MTVMNQNWDYYVFDLDENEDEYNTVSAMMKCGLLDKLVGGITQATSHYSSKIGPGGGGGGGALPPSESELASDSDPSMALVL